MPASELFRTINLSTHALTSRLSISLQPHQIQLLTGPSGSGKSLLLRAMADLDPHQGEICMNGQSQSSIPPGEWRRQVAYIAAETAWWDASVGSHFLRAPEAQMLSGIGFSSDVLNWRVERLSSGERQRLGILRALVLEPRVLLLDEPTANLDEENTLAVETMLKRYLKVHDAAAVWVSHNAVQRQRLGGNEVSLA